jgi:knotted carbamoyltransferase YgeW
MATPEKIAEIKSMIAELRALEPESLFDKDWLLTWEMSEAQILATHLITKILKACYEANISVAMFDGALAVSNFRDNSTRTRFSFAKAANLLGLRTQDLDESKSQIAHGETVRETATMISFLTEIIGIRDDKYLDAGHAYQVEVAESLDESHAEGVIAQRPAVVNLQCDKDHPTQSMSDLAHIAQLFGGIEGIKGKKIAMTWAYSPSYGKPLSVPQGIIGLLTRFGADVHLAHPEGYELLPEVIEVAKKNAAASGGSFTQSNSMDEAFAGAHIVYPKSWMDMATARAKGDAYAAGTLDEKTLEARALAHNANFKDWECTEERMALAAPDAHYMHCLPADITDVSCKEGEVAASVFERFRLETYSEAGYKPYTIAAMMAMTRMPEIARTLEELVEENKPRRRM